jgi:hypothetical protein
VTAELKHETLTEFHHLVIAFAFRVKIRAAFAAADGKTGQRILEYLLEPEEFDDAEVH